jgi:hypothetical protein
LLLKLDVEGGDRAVAAGIRVSPMPIPTCGLYPHAASAHMRITPAIDKQPHEVMLPGRARLAP